MFKSVFTKYLTTFLIIIVVSFIILIAIINSLISNYAVSAMESSLHQAANSMSISIQSAYKDYIAEYEGTDSESQLDINGFVREYRSDVNSMIVLLSHNINELEIIVTDLEGYDVMQLLVVNETSYGTEESYKSALLSVNKLPFTVNNRLKGGYSFYRSDDIDGYFDKDYLVWGVPIKVSGVGVIGGVLACVSDPGMNELLNAMIKTIIMVILWIMLIMLIAIYFLTEKITSPLKSMSRAAKQFAAGQFDIRVPVRGKDEVAELAKAFNNMAESLESLEQMRNSFMANVSHDLRTPMTTIAGFIDNILAGAIPPEKQDYYLGVIATEVRRLSRLVGSLLDISRLQAGQRKFNMAPFDVCELARQILISFEQKIDDKHLDVEFISDEDNIIVVGDRDAVHQIMYNICDNGIKFSKDGGKYVIEIHQIQNRKVQISVFNEGIGIAPEDIKYVFDRFYKSDKTRGIDKNGVGLGLYICKTIIAAHGEDLWVESEYGKNCKFIFTLPKAGDK